MKKIAVLLIATNKYHQFVSPLLRDIEKNFLPKHKITVHLFNDKEEGYESSINGGRMDIRYHSIPSYGFPEATLLRYNFFNDKILELSDYEYLFYMDVDMSIPLPVGEEILQGDITAVRHPGYYTNGVWGSPNNSPESTSYIEPEERKKYYAGGFQGGKTVHYLGAVNMMSRAIDRDKEKGVMAEWHDETHWNTFLNSAMPRNFSHWVLNELTPEYCNVPSIEQREIWGIDHLPGRILALDKNHAEIRS